jgi:hypothetical protein
MSSLDEVTQLGADGVQPGVPGQAHQLAVEALVRLPPPINLASHEGALHLRSSGDDAREILPLGGSDRPLLGGPGVMLVQRGPLHHG